jgi:hypothetical protein
MDIEVAPALSGRQVDSFEIDLDVPALRVLPVIRLAMLYSSRRVESISMVKQKSWLVCRMVAL